MTAPVSFAEAFRFWLKLGFISFGGPAGQIAVMHQELVERRRWISEGRFLHALNYCMLLPGPEAQQLATYIGWLMHRTWGGIVAGGLFVLPRFRDSHRALVGVCRPWRAPGRGGRVPRHQARGCRHRCVRRLAHRQQSAAQLDAGRDRGRGVSFVGGAQGSVSNRDPGCGPRGLDRRARGTAAVRERESHAPTRIEHAPALIDDDTPAPAHARHSPRRLISIAAVGIAAWLLVMALLAALQGMHGTAPVMGWFFTKAALLTFGGAYAVLPYVYQGAVEQYRWLTPGQMIDGLALGETTPGPLIMVVTFVGFVGAWAHASGASPLFAALTGAFAATYFTFLPSFLFIFAGGPLVEATRGNLRFTAPLTAITAAVVGVIANLALFFAYHVFWPRGFEGAFDWISLSMTAAAFVALVWFKVGPIAIVVAGAVTGVILRLAL